MPQNPYEPPRSRLEDRGAERQLRDAPWQVRFAVRLLWGTMLLALPLIWLDYLRQAAEPEMEALPPLAYLLIMLPMLAVFCVLIVLIGRGRNWARHLYAGILLVSTPFVLIDLAEQAVSAGEVLLHVVCLTCDALALWWLYTTPGKLWFADPGQS